MTAPPPEALLAAADALRDARAWPEAAAAYRTYLARRPDHWQIHVQLGHAEKESGRAEAALAAYARAGALAPEEAEPALQEGLALRALGEGGAAARRLAAARALAPDDPTIALETALSRHRLVPLPEGPAGPLPAAPDGPPTQLAFDVTDLLAYLAEARTPTGIQRVQLGLLGAVLDGPAPPVPLALLAYDAAAERWWEVDRAAFDRMRALARAGAAEADPDWRAAVAALCAAAARPPGRLLPGASLVALGNAWGIEDYFRGLRRLRRRVPLRYVAFLHDCVPLSMPEHCAEGMARRYAAWFAALGLQADQLLSNSRATAAEAARFGAPLGLPLPATPLPLAADPPPDLAAAEEAAAALDPPAPDQPFVLFVATLESRKNHRMVFQAWLELARRLGEAATPVLACVGRPGWHAEGALELLGRSPVLRRKVRRLEGVSDLALAGLARRSLFTLYNSVDEGWGLPVTESLALGVPCVAPAVGGLREAGAPGACPFPPGDLPALVALLARLATDPAARAAAAAGIDRAAAGRGWADAAADLLAALMAPPPPPRRPTLPAGPRIALGRAEPPPSRLAAWGEAVRDGPGWWAPEPWGCWTRDGVATLALPLDVPAGAAVRVRLELRGPPGGVLLRLRLRGATAGPWHRLRLPEGAAPPCLLAGRAGAGGVALDLDAGDGAALGDAGRRRVGAGVVALAACAEDDLPARLALLEAAG